MILSDYQVELSVCWKKARLCEFSVDIPMYGREAQGMSGDTREIWMEVVPPDSDALETAIHAACEAFKQVFEETIRK